MGLALALLLCAADGVQVEPSAASNRRRQVRLHVDTEDHALRIIDASNDSIVCYGTCDAQLPAERQYRTLELESSDTHEFALNEIREEAVFKSVRRPKLIVAGGIVMGIGAAMLYGGLVAFMVGWAASGNGLNSQTWPTQVARDGLMTAAVGVPIVLVGIPFALFGLRATWEVSERIPPAQ